MLLIHSQGDLGQLVIVTKHVIGIFLRSLELAQLACTPCGLQG